MQTSDAINEIAEALIKAQTVIKAPTKNREVEVKMRTGGKYKFKYATLDSVIEHVRKPLTENGLWFIQTAASRDSVAVMETMLMHKSGQWIRGEQPLRIDGQGNQEIGSAVTYAKRYGLCAMLGLAADEDDDANAADGNSVRDLSKSKVGAMGGPLKKTELKDKMRKFAGDLAAVSDETELVAMLNSYQDVLDQCQRDLPEWWYGDEGDVAGAMDRIEERRKDLKQADTIYDGRAAE